MASLDHNELISVLGLCVCVKLTFDCFLYSGVSDYADLLRRYDQNQKQVSNTIELSLSYYAPVPLADDATVLARRTKKKQIRGRYATYAQGSSFTLWIRQTRAVESPRCARHARRAPSNFEHAKKNRRAIAEHKLRCRCAVDA